MLKFFRKIRRKIIEEGNLKNYLFYSIGEILLVVIGILIAVQINNSNQNNSNKRELHNSYENLYLDLKNDIIKFKEVNSVLEGRIEAARSILLLLLKKNDISDIKELHKISEIWNPRLSYNNGMYQTFIGTGLLYKEKNEEIILQINEYYTELEITRSNMESMSNTNRFMRDQEVLIPFHYVVKVDDTGFCPHSNMLLWMNDPQKLTYQALYNYLRKSLHQFKTKQGNLKHLTTLNESLQKSILLILNNK